MYHPSTIQTTSRFLVETGPQLKEGMSNLEKVVMTEIALYERVWIWQYNAYTKILYQHELHICAHTCSTFLRLQDRTRLVDHCSFQKICTDDSPSTNGRRQQKGRGEGGKTSKKTFFSKNLTCCQVLICLRKVVFLTS